MGVKSSQRGNLKRGSILSIAEFYHEGTKYFPESLSSSAPDPLEKPPIFKEYLSERTVDLKPFLKGVPEPKAKADDSQGMLRSISRLLYHTAGITDIVEGRGGPIYFRAAPSAGALYPTEVYLATRGIEGLSDGIHSYSVREHSLVPTWDGDFGAELEEYCFHHPAAARAPMFLILTAVLRRSAWRYRERAYRRILLDIGHILGNAVAYAPVEGLGVVTVGAFYDAAVNDLLFLDPAEETVFIIAPIVPRGEGGSILSSPFPWPSSRTPPPPGGAEKPLMHLLHERSGILPASRSAERVPQGPMALPLELAGSQGSKISLGGGDPGAEAIAPSIGPVIRRRRSCRAFGRHPLPLPRLAGILKSSYAPVLPYLRGSVPLLADRSLIDPTMVTTFIAATRVEGLPAGVYRYDTEGSSLHLRREGDFGTEIWNLCLGQDLGRHAAVAVFHVADLPACVNRYGDRAYRFLHIDAGHIGERINLAAVARDVGVTGIGGFFDEEVNALLDLPDHHCALYITLLGNPREAGE
jgi:SagB-type dehydrogenase family enzyme